MSDKVIELLNEARSRELTAIIQYMAQHYELGDKGIKKLAADIKGIAIQEMKHAESLAERILFLQGVPTSKPDGTAIMKGQDMAAMLKTNIGLEKDAITMYNAASLVCAAEKDQISKQLFEKLLGDEEEHLNYFENTLEHIEKLGAAYQATLMG